MPGPFLNIYNPYEELFSIPTQQPELFTHLTHFATESQRTQRNFFVFAQRLCVSVAGLRKVSYLPCFRPRLLPHQRGTEDPVKEAEISVCIV